MRFWKIIAAVACFVSGVAHADSYLASKDGSMVLDMGTGLVWMRCSVGQKWSGESCNGVAEEYDLQQARLISNNFNARGTVGGITDWVIPTIRQLASLRVCSKGAPIGVVNDGKAQAIPKECPDFSVAPTLSEKYFPSSRTGLYLSSSVDGDYNWLVSFNNGGVAKYRSGSSVFVRFVRSDSVTMQNIAKLKSDFSSDELENWVVEVELKNKMQREAEELRKEEERKRVAAEERQRAIDERRWEEERKKKAVEDAADERRREEERKRKAAEEAAAERASLQEAIAKGAQQLYLLAGQAQRGKDVQIRSRRFGAVELYELIVEHFPKSDFAVKATDQLTAISRNESLSRAASEGQNRAQQQMENQRENQRAASRQQCEAQKQTCFSGCGQSSYWNGRSYVDNQSWSGCRSRCESISCY